MKTDIEKLFETLWETYSRVAPQVTEIKKLFEKNGDTVKNDHIALRCFNFPESSIDNLTGKFLEVGYSLKDRYEFPNKHLEAVHLEKEGSPLVFISQIKMEKFSHLARRIIKETVLPAIDSYTAEDFICGGRNWEINYSDYLALLKESEYLAWLYVFGFVPNHFTIDVNELDSFDDISDVNDFLKKEGYELNTSGGEVKGSMQDKLRQSSTKAQKIKINFTDQKNVKIPSCYYEFAQRYNNFKGFIADSADKIFESTDRGSHEKA